MAPAPTLPPELSKVFTSSVITVEDYAANPQALFQVLEFYSDMLPPEWPKEFNSYALNYKRNPQAVSEVLEFYLDIIKRAQEPSDPSSTPTPPNKSTSPEEMIIFSSQAAIITSQPKIQEPPKAMLAKKDTATHIESDQNKQPENRGNSATTNLRGGDDCCYGLCEDLCCPCF